MVQIIIEVPVVLYGLTHPTCRQLPAKHNMEKEEKIQGPVYFDKKKKFKSKMMDNNKRVAKTSTI